MTNELPCVSFHSNAFLFFYFLTSAIIAGFLLWTLLRSFRRKAHAKELRPNLEAQSFFPMFFTLFNAAKANALDVVTGPDGFLSTELSMRLSEAARSGDMRFMEFTKSLQSGVVFPEPILRKVRSSTALEYRIVRISGTNCAGEDFEETWVFYASVYGDRWILADVV